MTHWLTADGYNVMLRGLAGDAIKFTKIKYGNGILDDDANDLKNPLFSLDIESITRGEKHVTLTVSFKNVELDVTDFWATEIGVYVEDPDDSSVELCYCIWAESEIEKADYINPSVERLLSSQYDFVVFVSEAENVSASLGETLLYATVTLWPTQISILYSVQRPGTIPSSIGWMRQKVHCSRPIRWLHTAASLTPGILLPAVTGLSGWAGMCRRRTLLRMRMFMRPSSRRCFRMLWQRTTISCTPATPATIPATRWRSSAAS